MADAISVSGPISGSDKTLTFATGRLAPQSQGAVEVSVGDTTALVTANGAKDIREGIDFFPLTVDVEEKAYAAGKIPGSFFRREGRPSDQAVLVCRLIDRPLRPSFAEGYRNETQVVATIIGSDQENPYDVLGHQRRLRRADALGPPLRGPHRCRAPGVQHRRRLDPAPHLPRGPRSPPSRSWSPVGSSATTSPS